MQTKKKVIEKIKVVAKKDKKLVLYNDEVNTFEGVIETLMKVCKHDLIQAEQCTSIIHHNGSCVVKIGLHETVAPLCERLLNLGLTAQLE